MNTEDSKILLNYSASAVSVDCKGKYAVLGARRGLCVVTLDRPKERKFLYHNRKCEVGSVQFNPHMSKSSYIANTVSDTVQVWDIVSQSSLVTSFKGHNSAITGLVWSPADDFMLGTCSTDSYLKLWDTRDPAKPVRSFCAFTSIPSQLRWNPLSSHILASAHDGEVRIWDTRKTDTYVSFITAHFSSISSLDWSPKRSEQLVTCAQDRQIKVWDVNMPLEFKIKSLTAKPVSKIRYTPFGEGLVSVSAKDDLQIRLWSLTNDELININVFSGHTDVIKSFDFRNRSMRRRSPSVVNNSTLSSSSSMDFSDYQLISWSKDQTLRTWTLNQQMQEDCGFFATEGAADPLARNTPESDGRGLMNQSSVGSNGSSITSTLSSSIRGWIRRNKNALNNDVDENMTYSQECTKVANDMEELTLEENNAVTRSCTFRVDFSNCHIRLKALFPSLYPRGAVPMFEFLPSKFLTIPNMKKLKEKLNHTAEEFCLNQNRLCMGACMSDLLGLLHKMDFSEEKLQSENEESIATPETRPLSSRGMRHQILEEEDHGDEEIAALIKQTKTPTSDSNPTPTRRRSKFITDDKRVPAPATAVGVFSPTGHFVYFNSFSMRDFTTQQVVSPDSDASSNNETKPKGLNMRTYEDWKRRMFKSRRRKFDESDVSSDKSVSKPNGNLQDYFQNFFSGYSSKDLRVSSSEPGSMDEKITLSQKNEVIEEVDEVDESSVLDSSMEISTDNLAQQTMSPNPNLIQQQQIKQRKQQLQEVKSSSSQGSRRQNRSKKLDLRVHIYDLREVTQAPISIPLAQDYSLFGTGIQDICLRAQHTCIKHNNMDVAKVWGIISQICDDSLHEQTVESAWISHPLKTTFIPKLFEHFLKLRDIQTLAVLSCVLSQVPNQAGEYNFLLDPKQEPWFNHYRLFYADLLHRWGMNCQRNEIMKFVSNQVLSANETVSHICSIELAGEPKAMLFKTEEFVEDYCDRDENTEQDEETSRRGSVHNRNNSKRRPLQPPFKCAICRLPSRGLSTICPKCGHGGHIEHMNSWFARNECCPTGCGCDCVHHMDSYPCDREVEDASLSDNESDISAENRPSSEQTLENRTRPISRSTTSYSDISLMLDDNEKIGLRRSISTILPTKSATPVSARAPKSATAGFKFQTYDYNLSYF